MDVRKSQTRASDLIKAGACFVWAAASALALAALVGDRPFYSPDIKLGKPECIIFVVIDALRPDHLSCYGYNRDTSPNIDRLAREGALFERAYTNGNWTRPSIGSLFTGLWPFETGLRRALIAGPDATQVETVMSPDVDTLAERLAAQGYFCAGFVATPNAAAILGFSQGFGVYEQTGMDCDQVVARFLAWRREAARGRYFAYLHILEPHAPYAPREPFKSAFAPGIEDADIPAETGYGRWGEYRDAVNAGKIVMSEARLGDMKKLYDAEIAWSDSAVGELVNALVGFGDYQEALIVVMADHGENFLEHGIVAHPLTGLYEQQIRIPLVMKLPSSWNSRPVRVDVPVQTMDVTFTVAAAAGEGLGRGRNLIPAVFFGSSLGGTVVTESARGFVLLRNNMKSVFFESDRALQISGLYRIGAGNRSEENILAMKPSYAGRLTAKVARWRAFLHARNAGANISPGVLPDEERLRQLKALGYLN